MKNGEDITLKEIEDELSSKGLESRIQIFSENSTIQDKDIKWLIRTKDIVEYKEEQEVFWKSIENLQFKITYMSFYKVEEEPISWVVPNPIENFVRAKPSKRDS